MAVDFLISQQWFRDLLMETLKEGEISGVVTLGALLEGPDQPPGL
jgi:hypothetical protein